MPEENTDSVNLDLNLGPSDNSHDISETGSGSHSSGSLNLGNLLDIHRHGYRGPRPRVFLQNESSLSWRQDPNLFETGNAGTELTIRDAPQIGSSGVVSGIRPAEISKISENISGISTNGTRDKKEDGENHEDERGFFDCKICLDLAKEPVVTCCGHLFCWPCIYRWLHHHSRAKECPVCKGRVTVKNIIPIYGFGPNTSESAVDSSMKIPPRPQARRAERLLQLIQRIRRVVNSSDFGHGTAPSHFQSNSTTTNVTAPVSSSQNVQAEFFIRPYVHLNHMESNQEPTPTFEDRDSMSNIGVIHSGDRTVDNTAEIDSTGSRPTRSSTRRNGSSRDSDAASGDSPRTRRRRLS